MKMFRLLKASEIECRISTVKQNGVSLLLYKDARCDQNILDETVGAERWQRKHELIDGKLFCSVGIRYQFDGAGEWIWKQDVGTESFTEKEKGQASDSFKRACFNWGIGRELYSAPFIWITSKEKGGIAEVTRKPNNNGFTCFDRFSVSHIAYSNDETISELEIVHDKSKLVAFRYGTQNSRTVAETPISPVLEVPTRIQLDALYDLAKQKGQSKANVLKAARVKSESQMTMGHYMAVFERLQKLKDVRQGNLNL